MITLTYRWEPAETRALKRELLLRSSQVRAALILGAISIVLTLAVSAVFVLITIACISLLIGTTVRAFWPSGSARGTTDPTTLEIAPAGFTLSHRSETGTGSELFFDRRDLTRVVERGRFVLVKTTGGGAGVPIPASAMARKPEALEAIRGLTRGEGADG